MLQFRAHITIGLALLLTGAAPALAGPNGTEWLQRMQKTQPAQTNPLDGVWVSVKVRNVDRTASLLTISHGAIGKIGMPPMTMTFPVEDGAHLAMLHEGDVVDIQVANRDGLVKILGFRMNH